MPAFDYSALDLRGHTRAGTVDAATPRDARALLEKRQLVPVTVEPATQQHTAGRGGRFGPKDLALLTRQLSTLVASAPLEEALRTIGSQSDRRGVRRVVMATHAQVLEGRRDRVAHHGERAVGERDTHRALRELAESAARAR